MKEIANEFAEPSASSAVMFSNDAMIFHPSGKSFSVVIDNVSQGVENFHSKNIPDEWFST
jgi:hypothetical protein